MPGDDAAPYDWFSDPIHPDHGPSGSPQADQHAFGRQPDREPPTGHHAFAQQQPGWEPPADHTPLGAPPADQHAFDPQPPGPAPSAPHPPSAAQPDQHHSTQAAQPDQHHGMQAAQAGQHYGMEPAQADQPHGAQGAQADQPLHPRAAQDAPADQPFGTQAAHEAPAHPPFTPPAYQQPFAAPPTGFTPFGTPESDHPWQADDDRTRPGRIQDIRPWDQPENEPGRNTGRWPVEPVVPGAPPWEPPPAFTAAAAGMPAWPAPVSDPHAMPPWPAATGELEAEPDEPSLPPPFDANATNPEGFAHPAHYFDPEAAKRDTSHHSAQGTPAPTEQDATNPAGPRPGHVTTSSGPDDATTPPDGVHPQPDRSGEPGTAHPRPGQDGLPNAIHPGPGQDATSGAAHPGPDQDGTPGNVPPAPGQEPPRPGQDQPAPARQNDLEPDDTRLALPFPTAPGGEPSPLAAPVATAEEHPGDQGPAHYFDPNAAGHDAAAANPSIRPPEPGDVPVWPPTPPTGDKLPELPFSRDTWGQRPSTSLDVPRPPAGGPAFPPGAFKQPPFQTPPPPPPPAKSKRALLVTLGALALAGVATGGFFAIQAVSGAPPTTAAARSTPPPTIAEQSPPAEGAGTSILNSEQTDPQKLSLSEAFPKKKVGAAGTTFTRVKADMETTCEKAATGEFADALKEQKCSRVLRATYVDSKRRYAVTTGIAVLPDRNAATTADQAKNLSRNIWFRPLPGPEDSGGERVHIAGGYAAGLVWGRYIVFSYATHADGHTPEAKDKTLPKVSGAFRDQTSLVLERRITKG
ncbi:hypothetical protein [Nonomuraea sp. GTA35]|uniref:hypothetical protein n=1 Tax=Nonomuraea sp. GTA35 TaxID=1676746 RepID=UPI0035C13E89